jgi:histone H2A
MSQTPTAKKTKKTRSTDVSPFETYISRVLKNETVTMGIAGDAAATVDNICIILIDRVAYAILLLSSRTDRRTLSVQDVESAIQLVIPPVYQAHLLKRCNEAVEHYKSSKETREEGKTASRSSCAGLIFPVTRVQTMLMRRLPIRRKSDTAAVCLTAFLEQVVRDIIVGASHVAEAVKKKRIVPRHIVLFLRTDPGIGSLFARTVLSGGVVPQQIERPAQKAKTIKTQKKVETKTQKKETKTQKKASPPAKAVKSAMPRKVGGQGKKKSE